MAKNGESDTAIWSELGFQNLLTLRLTSTRNLAQSWANSPNSIAPEPSSSISSINTASSSAVGRNPIALTKYLSFLGRVDLWKGIFDFCLLERNIWFLSVGKENLIFGGLGWLLERDIWVLIVGKKYYLITSPISSASRKSCFFTSNNWKQLKRTLMSST